MADEPRPCPEMLTPASPPGLRITQVTGDDSRDSENIYMDTPSWTPDSRRFAFRRGASEDGRKRRGLWLCDLDDGCRSRPLVEYETEADFHSSPELVQASYGACLAPDGRQVYHLVRRGDAVEVRQRSLADDAETVVSTAPARRRIRGCMTMSADSRRLLLGVWLGDGKTAGAPWGADVFDLAAGSYQTIEFGNGFRNMHCQYAKDPNSHDVCLCGSDGKLSDGSWLTPPDGSWRWQNMPPPFAPGAGSITGIHVVRDDGTDWRMVPIGDGDQLRPGGHHGFRGVNETIVSAVYDTRNGGWRSPIFEATPLRIPRSDPEYWRGQLAESAPAPIDLSRRLARADSCHIDCNASGEWIVSDTDGYAEAKYSFVWIGRYRRPDDGDAYLEPTYLCLPRSSWKDQPSHSHPVLSPDGRSVVIQSDFHGRPQVYLLQLGEG